MSIILLMGKFIAWRRRGDHGLRSRLNGVACESLLVSGSLVQHGNRTAGYPRRLCGAKLATEAWERESHHNLTNCKRVLECRVRHVYLGGIVGGRGSADSGPCLSVAWGQSIAITGRVGGDEDCQIRRRGEIG